MDSFTSFEERQGAYFTGLWAVEDILVLWTGFPFWIVAAALLGLFLVMITIGIKRWSMCLIEEPLSFGLLMIVLSTIAMGYLMKTPPPRVYAPFVPFFLVPVARLVGSGVRCCFSGKVRSVSSAVLASIMAIGLIVTIGKPSIYHYPMENWMASAKLIEDMFPEGTTVSCPFRPHLFQVYLSDAYPLTERVDLERVVEGREVVLDADVFADNRLCDSPEMIPFAKIRIPQRRNAFQGIIFSPMREGVQVTVHLEEGPSPPTIELHANSAGIHGLLVRREILLSPNDLLADLYSSPYQSPSQAHLTHYTDWIGIQFINPVRSVRIPVSITDPAMLKRSLHTWR